jgi:group I intron endonuclease
MKSGIYLLTFSNGSQYVGQAQDIEARWKQHTDKFKKGQAAKKMQDAYDMHGFPDAEVLIYCHKDYLDLLETYYIHQYCNNLGNLNTLIPKLDNTVDYDNLMLNKHMLEFSTVDLMLGLIETAQSNTKLTHLVSELEKPFNKHLAEAQAIAELKEGKDNNLALAKIYYEAFDKAQIALNQLRSRGWVQRLFNFD